MQRLGSTMGMILVGTALRPIAQAGPYLKRLKIAVATRSVARDRL